MNRNPVFIGTLGEISTIKKCIENNLPVYKPIIDLYGVDLIIEFNNKLNKVQVKSTSTTPTSTNNPNCRIFSLTNQCITINNNMVKSNRYLYDKNIIDYFALYDAIDDNVYLLRNNGTKQTFTINKHRLNNQKINTNSPEKYDFDNVIKKSKLEKRDGRFVIKARSSYKNNK